MIGKITVRLGDPLFSKCWKCDTDVDRETVNSYPVYDSSRNNKEGIFYTCHSCYDEFMAWAKNELPDGYEIFFVMDTKEAKVYNRPVGSTWIPEM